MQLKGTSERHTSLYELTEWSDCSDMFDRSVLFLPNARTFLWWCAAHGAPFTPYEKVSTLVPGQGLEHWTCREFLSLCQTSKGNATR